MNAPRIAAVIGHPVSHSLSPVMHQAAFDAAGVDWTYTAFDVAPGRVGEAIAAMRTLGLAGLSVTMPHKSDVVGAVDALDAAAQALDSVNTVSWDGDRLIGSSTDGVGFLGSLNEVGIDVADAHVAVLGAGGAARAVIDAVGRAGAGRITVVNRTAQRAEQAASLSKVASIGSAADIAGSDIVVNATSIGMGIDSAHATDDDLACDPDLLHSGQIIVDLVYHPLTTPWLAAGADRGARTVDGLGMLIHQAALQQLQWLGTLPDVSVMRAAAMAELAARAGAEGRG